MAKEKICGIYCIENIINHKKYIGQSQNVFRRMYNHKNLLRNNKHHNSYLQNSWNKYGEKSFIFYLIEVCDMSNIDDLERYYISKFNTTDSSKGYNLESGGNIGKKHSLKTIEKLLDAFDTEMNILHKLSYDDIEAVVGTKLADNIEAARTGKMKINAGGGGVYGKVVKE